MRSAATGLCALAVVVAVIPLAVLQIPDAIAWALPASLAAAGPNAVASLLRASSLALPAMAIAVPLGALAVRRMRAGPVLLAGLLVIAAGDLLGGAARTVLEIGADRSLHGLGAGIAVAAVVAIVAEQRTAGQQKADPRKAAQQKAGQQQAGQQKADQRKAAQQKTEQQKTEQQKTEQRRTGQWLAGWWAAVTVAGLAAAPELMRQRVTSGDWHAALQPYPWLTGAALALAALYAVLAEGTVTAAARSVFPVAERSQLALLAAPVAGMCAITVAVSYQGDRAVDAAAVGCALALAGIAAITARAGTAARFAVVCAVTGFTLAPAAGAVTALTQPTVASGCAALAAALCGAAIALMPRCAQAGSRAITAVGLLLAASGFCALYLAGTGRPPTLLCVPLAAGLAAALTSSLRATATAGAMAGVVILLAGVVAGYLAAGAWQLHALAGARTAQAIHGALVTAAGGWALVAAAVTAAVALALAGTALAGTWRESGTSRETGTLRETGTIHETGTLRETGTMRESGHLPRSEPAGELDDAGAGSPPASAGGAPDHG